MQNLHFISSAESYINEITDVSHCSETLEPAHDMHSKKIITSQKMSKAKRRQLTYVSYFKLDKKSFGIMMILFRNLTLQLHPKETRST